MQQQQQIDNFWHFSILFALPVKCDYFWILCIVLYDYQYSALISKQICFLDFPFTSEHWALLIIFDATSQLTNIFFIPTNMIIFMWSSIHSTNMTIPAYLQGLNIKVYHMNESRTCMFGLACHVPWPALVLTLAMIGIFVMMLGMIKLNYKLRK